MTVIKALPLFISHRLWCMYKRGSDCISLIAVLNYTSPYLDVSEMLIKVKAAFKWREEMTIKSWLPLSSINCSRLYCNLFIVTYFSRCFQFDEIFLNFALKAYVRSSQFMDNWNRNFCLKSLQLLKQAIMYPDPIVWPFLSQLHKSP